MHIFAWKKTKVHVPKHTHTHTHAHTHLHTHMHTHIVHAHKEKN